MAAAFPNARFAPESRRHRKPSPCPLGAISHHHRHPKYIARAQDRTANRQPRAHRRVWWVVGPLMVPVCIGSEKPAAALYFVAVTPLRLFSNYSVQHRLAFREFEFDFDGRRHLRHLNLRVPIWSANSPLVRQ
jgi:hypothetical protein